MPEKFGRKFLGEDFEEMLQRKLLWEEILRGFSALWQGGNFLAQEKTIEPAQRTSPSMDWIGTVWKLIGLIMITSQ